MSPGLILLAAVAPFVGSFLGVVIDRLPHGRDVIAAPSRCDACGARLGWRELVPVLSWLWQAGRCARCRARLPRHLPLVEGLALAAAGLAIWGAGRMGFQGTAHLLAAWGLAGAFWALIVLGAIDAVWLRLPDGPLAALALCGAVVGVLDPLRGTAAMLAGAAAAGGAFWAIRIGYAALRGREGLGFGDVKLMAALGLLLPLAALPLVVAIGGSLGVLWALARRGADGMARTTLVPFGTFLCLGAALTLILTWLPGPV